MKIIGNGLIGREFRKVADQYRDMEITVFASGVAKSTENRREEYDREYDMIAREISTGNKIIYFSTCSILQKRSTNYIAHKKRIEKVLSELCDCLIVRLPQVVGHNANANTLVEYFYRRLMTGKTFDVYANAYRSLIDVEDVARIVSIFLNKDYPLGNTLNISSESQVLAIDIVRWFEEALGITGNYNVISSKSDRLDIDLSCARRLLGASDSIFKSQYWSDVLRKYYL